MFGGISADHCGCYQRLTSRTSRRRLTSMFMNQQVNPLNKDDSSVEDTFILLDALEKDLPAFRSLCERKQRANDIPIVAEIGSSPKRTAN